jgi:hypothetical protein
VYITSPLSEQQRQGIAARLLQKGALQPCPRCRYSEFAIIDTRARIQMAGPVQTMANPNALTTAIETVMAVCTNCGFVSQHLVDILNRE